MLFPDLLMQIRFLRSIQQELAAIWRFMSHQSPGLLDPPPQRELPGVLLVRVHRQIPIILLLLLLLSMSSGLAVCNFHPQRISLPEF